MNFSAAATEISHALRIDPSCSQAFTMSALVKLASNDANGAHEDAVRATILDPNDAQAFLALATAYNSIGNYHEAKAAAEQTLRLRPDLWQAHLELAKVLYKQEQFEAALHELDLLKTDFPDVHLVRGNVLMRLGRRQDGAEEFRSFLSQLPRDPRGEQIKQIVASVQPGSNGPGPSKR